MLKAAGLKKCFGTITALDGLDLHVRKGEIYGFLGPNGAGKTTCIRIFSTLTAPGAGQALIGGFDVVRDPVRAKGLIGVVHQSLNVDPELSAMQNMTVHGMLYSMRAEEIRRRAGELLDFVGLGGDIGRKVGGFSGGMKRRLTFARALLHKPVALILDEPTAGLDAAARRAVWSLVRRVREDGATVFLTTHYIEEAACLSDRVGIIDRGRLIAEDTPERLVSSLGSVTVDVTGGGVEIFRSRAEALERVAGMEGSASVRATNLEDVFIRLTGRREQLTCGSAGGGLRP